MKKKTLFFIPAIALAIAGMSTYAYSTYAADDPPSTNQEEVAQRQQGNAFGKDFRGPRFSEEDRTALDTAVENHDYAAWKQFMEDHQPPRATDIVTQENFDSFAEMHALRREGKVDEANAKAEELGLPNKGMMHGNNGRRAHFADGNGDGTCDHRENISEGSTTITQ